MSRSGTSLTTRILNLGGVYLGPADGLLWHRATNREGHWESLAMLRFNEWLLRSQGGSWREPPRLAPGWERSEELARERRTARRFLADTYGGHDRWGWKDPRNCLTLAFWQRLLPRMRYVICLRNPLDVAASLQRREGFSLERSLDLWLAYSSAALTGTEGYPRIFVAYEDYFDDWRVPADRLTRFAGDVPAGKTATAAMGDTVKDSLRHYHSPAGAVFEDARVSAGVASLYERLSRLAAAEAEPLGACPP